GGVSGHRRDRCEWRRRAAGGAEGGDGARPRPEGLRAGGGPHRRARLSPGNPLAPRNRARLSRSGMRIAVVGAGPAGLFFALLMKRQRPADEIVVIEQNPRGATFGFGVVFSQGALEFLAR